MDGVEMFARYAYAPNHLGYCGPEHTTALRERDGERVRALARGFSGAWPYLRAMSRLTGVADPLDERLVASYWLGGGIGADLDGPEFLAELLRLIAPVAGVYWSHLGPALAPEAAANHSFHVFGVYPWTRVLVATGGDQPLEILDNCRITAATVLDRHRDDLTVGTTRLRWNGARLSLSETIRRTIPVWTDGYAALADAAPGDDIALHWGQPCGRLTAQQVDDLTNSTEQQLRVTNRRLAAPAHSIE
ncbi:DUF6390 family protein [Nocardia sp. CA-107356]|uniref:DUF6390 family protein n=1 Tax=Nocardia sp. CA-107356 TaxID=3239972 RepID=UPI003D93C1A4